MYIFIGGLKIAVKRREAKGKGEKERYTHVNAEFQRIARGHKKAFLSDRCKEIEEKNRMGKTRDLRELQLTKEDFMDRHEKRPKLYGPNRNRRY